MEIHASAENVITCSESGEFPSIVSAVPDGNKLAKKAVLFAESKKKGQ